MGSAGHAQEGGRDPHIEWIQKLVCEGSWVSVRECWFLLNRPLSVYNSAVREGTHENKETLNSNQY